MTGFEPSPILTFRFVVQRHYTSDCSCQTTAKLCNLCEEHVNVINTVADPDTTLRLPNPNEWKSTLMSGIRWGRSPNLYHINWRGGQLPDPNECNSTLTSETGGETLTPNPNECNSTLMSGTRWGRSPTYII